MRIVRAHCTRMVRAVFYANGTRIVRAPCTHIVRAPLVRVLYTRSAFIRVLCAYSTRILYVYFLRARVRTDSYTEAHYYIKPAIMADELDGASRGNVIVGASCDC